ncbi:hypothetical protein [uncultured Robinsoniella sp.]|uniref:hypothetical protein n=1 Tax=uncultured Robinsoniella sp. TaxID=904190 RepID=UPI00374E20EC
MAFTFSMKDTYRQSVEAASGGKQTVLYDNKGNPSIMNIVPRQTYKSLGISDNDKTHDAWKLDGREVPEIFIGTYLAYVHDGRAYSLPGQVPKVYTNHDQAINYCRAKGEGWHCMTNAEYAAIALWCKKNGFYPRGNNNYGSDHAYPHETCRPATVGSDGRTNLGITGSGPCSWTHDGTPSGIYGLNGDAWEWATGVRTVDGEVQILEDNNAALFTADLTDGSAQWKAILEDGTLVAPGTAGTIKVEPTAEGSGAIRYTKNVQFKTSGDQWPSAPFKSMAVEAGISKIPDIMKALALYRTDDTDHGEDRMWARNDGEKCFFRGGFWHSASYAGVFSLYGYDPRSASNSTLGFRPAYALL